MMTTTTATLQASLAAEVRDYLTRTPRQLPSRALYDALGSALFAAICELPWYPLTRAERRLIARHRREILASAGAPARLVELGPGNGDKLALLLGDPESRRSVQRIELIDVSPTALEAASRTVGEVGDFAITTHETRYEDGLAVTAKRRVGERTLLMFLGSNIGNFDAPGAAAFLRRARASLSPGDAMLIGVDLVKPTDELLRAYDDPLGVTAAFNRNLLVHLNQALGATFDIAGFDHRAVWNARDSRVEMHLVSNRAQTVEIPAAGLRLSFNRHDAIWTESSYKYTPDTCASLLVSGGLTPHRQWLDSEGRFLLALATPA
jgi:L-histidine Nalpha-methyltransferase